MVYETRDRRALDQYDLQQDIGSRGQDRKAPVQRLTKPKLEYYSTSDLEIYGDGNAYRARLPYTIRYKDRVQERTLEVILNGNGRNKAIRKVERFLAQLKRQLEMPS